MGLVMEFGAFEKLRQDCYQESAYSLGFHEGLLPPSFQAGASSPKELELLQILQTDFTLLYSYFTCCLYKIEKFLPVTKTFPEEKSANSVISLLQCYWPSSVIARNFSWLYALLSEENNKTKQIRTYFAFTRFSSYLTYSFYSITVLYSLDCKQWGIILLQMKQSLFIF